MQTGIKGLIREIKTYLKRFPTLVNAWHCLSHWIMTIRHFIIKPKPQRFYNVILVEEKSSACDKHALLSYVVPPLPLTPDDPMFFFDRSIYVWHTYVIAQILNRLGYGVDLINWNDAKFTPPRAYDLYFAHGGIISGKIMQSLPSSAAKVYWASTMYWKYHNEQELIRLKAIQARRGVLLPVDRYVQYSEDEALRMADGVIGLGNQFIQSTYAGFSPVFMVNNMARPVEDFDIRDRDFENGRNHFLYFAGAGAVQKGLDLLLEAFSQLEYEHLWIAAPVEQDFQKLYQNELQTRSNIHYLGIIRPRWPDFIALMKSCCYVISASSGEGQPHAIIECMAYGLIPIVSVPCGIDVEDFGFLIEPCTIDRILDVVKAAARFDPTQCQTLSLNVQKVVAEKYSEQAFVNNVTSAIESILASANTP